MYCSINDSIYYKMSADSMLQLFTRPEKYEHLVCSSSRSHQWPGKSMIGSLAQKQIIIRKYFD